MKIFTRKLLACLTLVVLSFMLSFNARSQCSITVININPDPAWQALTFCNGLSGYNPTPIVQPTFSVASCVTGTSVVSYDYQWQKSYNGSTWITVTSGLLANPVPAFDPLTENNTGSANLTIFYRLAVKGNIANTAAPSVVIGQTLETYSANYNFILKPKVTIGMPSMYLTGFPARITNSVCSGTAVTLNALVANQDPFSTYQWQRSPNGLSPFNNNNDFTGFTNNTQNFTANTTTNIDDQYMRLIVYQPTPSSGSSIGCNDTSMVSVQHFVETDLPNVTPFTVGTLGAFCNGAVLPAVALTDDVALPTVFEYTYTGAALGQPKNKDTLSGATPSVPSFTGVNATNAPLIATITVKSYNDGNGNNKIDWGECTGTSSLYIDTVLPTPTVNSVSNQTVCTAATIGAINFSGFAPGTTYNWTNTNASIGLAVTGTGNIGSFTATNTTNTPQTATIVVTPVYTFGSRSCTGTPTTFTITINPIATVNTITSQVVCNNTSVAAVNFTSTASGGTIVYNWTNTASSIGLASTGSGNIGSFTGLNVGVAPVVATIVVTPTFTNNSISCVGTPFTFTITVNPTPNVVSLANLTFCNTTSVAAVAFAGSVSGTVFNWVNTTPAIGLANSGTGNIASFTGTNSGYAPLVGTITVTPSYTNAFVTCTGPDKSFTITINPTDTMNTTPVDTLCNGATKPAVVFTSKATGGTKVYSWTSNNTSIGLAASGTGNLPSFTATNSTVSPITATITVRSAYTNNMVTCNGPDSTFTITVLPTATVNSGNTNLFVSGTLTNTEPTFNRTTAVTQGGSCGLSGVGTAVPYKTHTFTLSVTSNVKLSFETADGGSLSGGDPDTYLLLYGPGGFVPATACTNIIMTDDDAGTGFSSLIQTTTPLPAGTYTVVVSSFNNVPGPPNSGIVLPWSYTLAILPSVIGTPAVQTVCNNTPTAALTFTSSAMGGAVTYSWVNSRPSVGLAASGTGNIVSFTAINNGNAQDTASITVTPTITIGNKACIGTPTIFKIIVNPTAKVRGFVNDTVCNGSNAAAVTFSTLATGGTVVYNWSNSDATIGLAAAGTGNIPSFAIVNLGTTPKVATITVKATYTQGAVSCQGPDTTFTITALPLATVNTVTNQALCHNTPTTAVAFATPATGATSIVFNWTNNTTSIGLAASGTGNIASFNATNTTTAPITATITVNATYKLGSKNCVGPDSTFKITVNPIPVLTVSPRDQVICPSSTAAPIVLTSNVSGSLYMWTTTNTLGYLSGFTAAQGTPTASPIAGAVIASTNGNLRDSVLYTITASANGCFSPAKIAAIQVWDTAKPVFTNCIDTITVSLLASCTGVLNYTIPTATDNCGTPTVVYTSGSTNGSNVTGVGLQNVVFTATDAVGNTATCTTVIKKVDVTLPNAVCNPITITLTALGTHTLTATNINAIAAGSTDNCTSFGSLIKLVSPNVFTCSNLGANIVTLTITDASGNVSTCTTTVTINSAITALSVNGIVDVTCFGTNTGSFTINSTGGGGGGVTYSWSGPQTGSTISLPIGTSYTQGGLLAGTYTVVATDGNGCSRTITGVTINQAATPLVVTATATPITCNNANDGKVAVTYGGGRNQLFVSYSGGMPFTTGSFVTVNTPDGFTVTNLGPGTYTITVRDQVTVVPFVGNVFGALSCTQTATATVINPTQITATKSITKTNATCFGSNNGSIDFTVNATGGTGAFTHNYAWYKVPNYSTVIATTQDLNIADSGKYVIVDTIKDANLCTIFVKDSIVVGHPSQLMLTNTVVVTNVLCNAGSNGAINISPIASGGTGAITVAHKWFKMPTLATAIATTEDLASLTIGMYRDSITLTDVNGCERKFVLNYTVTQPNAIVLTQGAVVNLSCNSSEDGSINVSATGGTGTLTYKLMPGNVTNNTGVFGTLSANTYTVTVTDVNTCIGNTLTIMVSQPAVLNISGGITQVISCNGGSNGSIAATATGGTAAYSYTISPAVNITGATSGIFTGLPSGSYTINVTDANSCSNVTNSIVLSNPSAIVLAQVGATTNVNCFGNTTGSITVNATGGVGASYTYTLNPGAVTNATGIFNGLAANNYTLTVVNNLACTANSLAISVSQPAAALNISASVVTNVNCFGGTSGAVSVTATGGTAPYNYVWTNTSQTSNNPTGLTAGTYQVTITDSKGCTRIQAYTVAQPIAALTNSGGAVVNVTCNGALNGSIANAGTGGTPSYTYVITSGPVINTTGVTSGTFTGLSGGSYVITITDSKGCTVTRTVTVNEPAVLLNNLVSSTNITTCNGASTGAITVSGSGGTAAYAYTIQSGPTVNSTGATTGIFTGLLAGTYVLRVTDVNACFTNRTVTITQPTNVVLNFTSKVDNACYLGIAGRITVNATGGTGAITYTILSGATINTTGATSGIFTGLAAGTYVIQAKDANNCLSTTNVTQTITQPAIPTLPTPDLLVGSTQPIGDLFSSVGAFKYILVNIRELNNVAATNVTLRITRNIGYTYQVDPTITSYNDGFTTYAIDNARWTNITVGMPANLTFALNNDPNRENMIACSATKFVLIKVTRNNINTGGINFTTSATCPTELTGIPRLNNTTLNQFTAE